MSLYAKYRQLFGLIGYPLSHSFSKKYFGEKFEKGKISDCFYELFPLEHITAFPELLGSHSNFRGINVTIPYKEQVIPFLDALSPEAEQIGAVNTIKIEGEKKVGYNTDVYGFEHSLLEAINSNGLAPKGALVLGTGGAAKAVLYVLNKLAIKPTLVSRTSREGQMSYEQLNAIYLSENTLIVNTTPLGMSPKEDTCPAIPYEMLGEAHLLYDLVYNPAETLFMRKGKEQGAKVTNGLQMLILQAEKAWEIWNT